MPYIIFFLLTTITTPLFTQTDFIISNSIIVVEGTNSLVSIPSTDKIRGILASIDWGKIPDLGLPAEEIHTIKILNRQTLSFKSNIIKFSPNIWRFVADSWFVDYTGSIPYLENLEFLPMYNKGILSTTTTMELTQNSLGYYKNALLLNIYQAVSGILENVVSTIYIVSEEDNQAIKQQIQLFDQISPKEFKQSSTNSIEFPQNIIEKIPTNRDVHENNYISTNEEEVNKDLKILDESQKANNLINTSLDKKNLTLE